VAGTARQLNGFVDDRVVRNTVEVTQLEGAQSQYRPDGRGKLVEPAAARIGKNEVERVLPAHRSGRKLQQQSAVSPVFKVTPFVFDRIRECRQAPLDGGEHAYGSMSDRPH
jgi:hypothetical protein